MRFELLLQPPFDATGEGQVHVVAAQKQVVADGGALECKLSVALFDHLDQ